MKRIAILLIVFSLSAAGIYAANFTCTLSNNPVAVGERFQVTFTIDSEGSNFRPPSFKGLNVLMGPQQSHNTSIINGRMSTNISLTYILEADKPGKYKIGSASISVGGKTLKSNPVTLEVVKGATQARNGQAKSQAEQAREIIKPNIFVRLNVSKKNVYLGEQVIATYKLYQHPELSLAHLEYPTMPEFEGFWSQDLEKITKLNYKYETIKGVRFQVATIKRVVLLPQRSGKLQVDPVELKCKVRLRIQQQRRRRDPFDFFDDPFGSYKDFDYTAKSSSATINVKPLPGSAPDDFSGGVGNIKMKAWLDRTKTKTNEPVTLKIQLSGKGNLKLIDPIDLDLPPDFETYEPKIADNLSISSGGYTGNKTFEYLLIPRHAGKFELDPVSLSYFDLDKKSYVTLRSDPFILEVDKGEGGEESEVVSGVSKEEIKYLGKDIRFIKDKPSSFERKTNGFYSTSPFFVLSLAPLFLFFVFFFVRRRNEEINRDQMLLKNKKASKAARKHLSTAKQYLAKSDRDKFYEELTHALWGYLSDKLGIPYSDLTKDNAREVLNGAGSPEEYTDMYLSTIDECEFARFAPGSESGGMKASYNAAVNAITVMEGKLK